MADFDNGSSTDKYKLQNSVSETEDKLRKMTVAGSSGGGTPTTTTAATTTPIGSNGTAAPKPPVTDGVNMTKVAEEDLYKGGKEAYLKVNPLVGGCGTKEESDYVGTMTWEELATKIEKETGFKIPKDVLEAPQKMTPCWNTPWIKPSLGQEKLLPILLGHVQKKRTDRKPFNIVFQLKNGGGKTGCFVMSAMATVNPAVRKPQILIITKDIAVANQIYDIVASLCKNASLPAPIRLRHEDRGEEQEQAKLQAASVTPIIIAQLGFLCKIALGKKSANNFKRSLRSLSLVIVDEADEILDDDSNEDVCGLFRRKHGLFTKIETEYGRDFLQNVTTLFVSATWPKPALDSIPKKFPNCVMILEEELDIKKMAIVHVDFRGRNDSSDQAFNKTVRYFVEKVPESTIVFCNRKSEIYALKDFLEKVAKTDCAIMHGGRPGTRGYTMSNERREKEMKEFRDGKKRVMLATNAIARGIDIPSVKLVISLSIPLKYGRVGGKMEPVGVDSDTFRHRIGRTARFGREGMAVAITTSEVQMKALGMVLKELDLDIKGRVRSLKATDVENDTDQAKTIIEQLLFKKEKET
eukprot:g3642.t1